MQRSPWTQRILVLSVVGAVATTVGFTPRPSLADTAVFEVAGSDAYIINADTVPGANYFDWNYQLAVPTYLPQFNSSWGTLSSANVAMATNLEGFFHTNVPAGGFLDWTTWVSIYDAGATPSTDGPAAPGSHSYIITGTYADPAQSGDQYYYVPDPTDVTAVLTNESLSTTSVTGTGQVGYQAFFYAEQTDSSLTGPGSQQDLIVGGYGIAITYTYTPPTGGPGSGGGSGGPYLIGSAGGGWVITNQPTGGWSDLIIASNGVLTIASGNSVSAVSITNYGILNQTGGSLTLTGISTKFKISIATQMVRQKACTTSPEAPLRSAESLAMALLISVVAPSPRQQ